jgi:outer membrane protein OmpA-like peptidoglycan-associated protein
MKIKYKYGIILLVFIVSIKLVAQNQSEFEISIVDFNTEYSDFGAIYYQNDIVYVSDKKNQIIIGRYDENTGRPYCRLYQKGNNVKLKALLDKINTKYHDGTLCSSKDGNLVFFTRNSYYKNKARLSLDRKLKLDIFYVIYENGKWGEIQEFPFNNSEYSAGHPYLSPDEKYVYFASDMEGSIGGTDIYRVKFDDGKWGLPENLGNSINSKYNELFPSLDENGILYFASEEDSGLGGLDLYRANPDTKSFNLRENLGKPMNSEFDDFALYLFNGKGFFASNRTNGKGLDDIYQVEDIFTPLLLSGTITNKKGEVLQNVQVDLVNYKSDDTIAKFLTGIKGNYNFEVQRNESYKILTKSKDYLDGSVFYTCFAHDTVSLLRKDIVMDDYPVFSITPIDEETNESIQEMKVSIDCDGKYFHTAFTNSEGVKWQFPAEYRVGDSVLLSLDFSKPGYISKTVQVNYVIEDGGTVIIPREQLVMKKAEVNMEISKLIEIDPIFYDFDKWNIRDDAAIQLEKVVLFLNENPEISIELSSHTDCRGRKNYNIELSDKRAKSAAAFIQKRINNPEQIYGKGYGDTKPAITCQPCKQCSEDEHAKNRRTEFTIVKVDKNNDTHDKIQVADNEADKVIYKVQVFSSSKLIDITNNEFENYDNVDYYVENKMFKYTIGKMLNYQDATKLKQKLSTNFEGCFVVAFRNGRKISIDEAIK